MESYGKLINMKIQTWSLSDGVKMVYYFSKETIYWIKKKDYLNSIMKTVNCNQKNYGRMENEYLKNVGKRMERRENVLGILTKEQNETLHYSTSTMTEH